MDQNQNPSQQIMQEMNSQASQQDQLRQQAQRPITLNLTLGDVNTILRSLDTGAGQGITVSAIVPIINKITSQAQAQATQHSEQPAPVRLPPTMPGIS